MSPFLKIIGSFWGGPRVHLAVSLRGFILGEGPALAELGASPALDCYNDPLLVSLGLLLWGWSYWYSLGIRPSQDTQRRENSLWSK